LSHFTSHNLDPSGRLAAPTAEATLTLARAARQPWEVVVVGAGPAGALAARELARRGRAVLLADRAAFPRWKVCGCCLNARALATLDAAGLGDLATRLGAVPLREVRVAGRDCRARLALPGGAVLSRTAFDAALVAEAVAAGAAFLPRTNATLGALTGAGRDVALTEGGTTANVRAALVLAADGLGGQFLGGAARPAPGSRVGAGTVAEQAPDEFAAGCVYMACGSGGYVGLTRLEDGRLDVAAAFDVAAVRRAGGPGGAAAAILHETGWPPVPDLARLRWRGTPPLTRRAARPAAERVLALGDAAGYVEPFTGEGIAWALASALAVAPLADRLARRWDPAAGRTWAALHRGAVGGRQGTCRAVARVLRHPRLAGAAIRLLGRFPGLAGPVVRRLNAIPALPKGFFP
jgi:flavin-dependent dehydrogenase